MGDFSIYRFQNNDEGGTAVDVAYNSGPVIDLGDLDRGILGRFFGDTKHETGDFVGASDRVDGGRDFAATIGVKNAVNIEQGE